MTQEEAVNIVNRTVCNGKTMCDEILSNGILKEHYLQEIKNIWNDIIKYTRGKSTKQYFREQRDNIINALTGNTTEVKKNIKKDDFKEKLLKFMKKNYPRDDIQFGDSYEDIVNRMIENI